MSRPALPVSRHSFFCSAENGSAVIGAAFPFCSARVGTKSDVGICFEGIFPFKIISRKYRSFPQITVFLIRQKRIFQNKTCSSYRLFFFFRTEILSPFHTRHPSHCLMKNGLFFLPGSSSVLAARSGNPFP